jgi:23S rRNA (adenine2503-C2)-methyltransferase
MLPEELVSELASIGEPRFRSVQIFSAIHARGVSSIQELHQLPKSLRDKLSASFIIDPLEHVKITSSGKFDTRKFLFALARDPEVKIETVLISEKGRNTVCVSTQAGCNVGCEFCATARLGFKLNLTAGEICSQVYSVMKLADVEITNVVYMGMGEPFLNYDSSLRSL